MGFKAISYGLALVLVCGPAFADGKKKAAGRPPAGGGEEAAMMAAMMKLGAPGEPHKALQQYVGTWTSNVKMFNPGGPPKESTGTAEVKSILGDRFVMEEDTGTFMNMPFQGKGFSGYDNMKKKYVSVWVDTMGTGIMMSEGSCDAAGKVFTWTANEIDPMTGQPTAMRMVDRFSDRKRVTEFYKKSTDGKEVKMMEITYLKK
jgi:hypothetical protein